MILSKISNNLTAISTTIIAFAALVTISLSVDSYFAKSSEMLKISNRVQYIELNRRYEKMSNRYWELQSKYEQFPSKQLKLEISDFETLMKAIKKKMVNLEVKS